MRSARGVSRWLFVGTVLGALLAFGQPVSRAADEGLALAVLGDKAEVAPLVSLVEVELSKGGARLVERAALDKVLQEQELGAGGLADRDALVKVGQLVRADAFLLLSLEEAPAADGSKERLLRVRVSETAHGIRFLDRFAGFAPDKLDATASDIGRDASAALAKLRLGPGQGVAVSVVDIHRVLLGEEHQPQCRTLRGLLAARLGAEPNVVVLEREDLMQLMGEKELTGGKGVGFWGSAVLVEGRLARAEGEQMELVLQVSPAGKEAREIGPFEVKVEALAEAAGVAAAAVMNVAGREGGGVWQPEVEAERFFRQGMLLCSHRRDEAALPLLETACALQPDNLDYPTRLLEFAKRSMGRGPWAYSPVQMAELAGRLTYRLRQIMGGPEDRDDQTLNLERWLRLTLQDYFTSPASTADERAVELNRAPRKLFADLYMRVRSSDDREGQLPAVVTSAATYATLAAGTPEEAVAGIKDYVRRRIMPPESGGEIASFAERCDAGVAFASDLSRLLESPGPLRHIFYNDHKFPDLLAPYFAELASSPDSIVALTGSMLSSARAGRALGAWREAPGPPSDQRPSFDKARRIIEQQFMTRTDVSPAAMRQMRFFLVRMGGAMHPIYSPEESIPIYEEVYGPLLEARDVDGILACGVPAPLYHLSDSFDRAMTAARNAALLDRIVEILAPEAGRPEVVRPLSDARSRSGVLKDGLRDYLDGLRVRAARPAAAGAEQVLVQISAIEKLLPELAPHAPARVLNVKPLVRKGDWFRPWSRAEWTNLPFSRAVYQDGVLWVCIADADLPMSVGLAGLDLKAGRTVALWQALLRSRYLRGDKIKGLAVGSQASYIAFQDEQVGIVEFPGGARRGRGFIEDPHILGEKDGLPVSRIFGIAFWNDKLWVAHTKPEGGLGIYDPAARKWRQVFDSAVPGPTALEGKGGYSLGELTASPAGLFFLGPSPELGRASPGRRGPSRPPGGLWRLIPGTNSPEFLTVAPSGTQVTATSPVPQICDCDFLAAIVPEERRVELLLTTLQADMRLALSAGQSGQQWLRVSKTFLAGSPQQEVTFSPAPEFGGLCLEWAAVHGDELWAPYGERQIAILHRGKTFKEADIIPNIEIDGERVLQFYSTPDGLVGVGRGVICLIEPGGK